MRPTRQPQHAAATATLLAAACLLAATTAAAEPADRLGVPGPIAFGGEPYLLGWSARPSPHYYKQEYLPAGQVPERYRDMVIVEAVIGDIPPAQAAAEQVRLLEARKASDPVTGYDLLQNADGSELILDFVLSDTSSGEVLVEWNAYRYLPLADGAGQAGTVLFAISRRAYGDDARPFMEQLGERRRAEIEALAAFAVPAVSPAP